MLGFVQRNVMGPQAQVPEMSGMGSCHMQLPFECGPQRKALAFQHKKRWVLQAPCVQYGCIAQQYTQPFCSALLHGSVVWSSSEIETIAKCLCAAEMSAGVTLGVSVARGMHCEPFKKENQILWHMNTCVLLICYSTWQQICVWGRLCCSSLLYCRHRHTSNSGCFSKGSLGIWIKMTRKPMIPYFKIHVGFLKIRCE